MGTIKKIEQDLLTILNSRTLVCDGAMGTTLQALGYKGPNDLLNLDPAGLKSIEDIHLNYIEAGSDIIQTNTLGANPLKLGQTGNLSNLEEINKKGINAAKNAINRFRSEDKLGRSIFIAGDIGPTGKLLEPYGDTKYGVLVDAFSSQAEIFIENGVDLIIIETMIDLKEALAVIEGIRKTGSKITIACTLSFKENGVTVMGDTAEEFGSRLLEAGCDIIGANCSVGSDTMIGITEKIRKANHDALLIIQPNAGLPSIAGDRTVFNETPEIMAGNFEEILKYNIAIAGACCGSTPGHIRMISEIVKKRELETDAL